MKRQTQEILYYTLPIAFWLLAGVVSVLPVFFSPFLEERTGEILLPYFLPALLTLTCLMIISRIRRHASSVEECFWVGLLLGVAACWMPTVLLVVLPVWGYLIHRNIFSFRSLLSTLIGIALVAVWWAVVMQFIMHNIQFSITKNLWAWVPTGSFSIAYMASKTARQNLRVR